MATPFLSNRDLTTHLQTRRLEQVVENRTAYTLEQSELCIYETMNQAYEVGLRFEIPILAGMITGKKWMHVDDRPVFEFLPGQSLILSPGKTCYIDFPEATFETPTQCLTLGIDPERVARLCETLNRKIPLTDSPGGWNYSGEGFHFTNDLMINQLMRRLIFIFTEDNTAKDFFANLVLQELLVRLMQTQARHILLEHPRQQAHSNRMAHVADFIQKNLQNPLTVLDLSRQAFMSEPHFFRCFKQQFGLSPIEFINEQRIKAARMMLQARDVSVTEVSQACGFNNLNYFLKMFKRATGMTPGEFRRSVLG